MIARILWLATLTGLAAITTVLQVDRQADKEPALARLVPAPMRGYAQRQIVLDALDADDPAAALAAAEALVRRRPMPAEHLTLLATAQAKVGQLQTAALTIQLAGQRGWREPAAQEAVLRLALAAGDKAEAARRYAALFRREATPDDLLIALGPEVVGEPGGAGREALAMVIVGATRWHSLFLQRGLRVLPPDALGEIITIALERGAPFDCEPLGQVVGALRQRDAVAAEKLAGSAARRCT